MNLLLHFELASRDSGSDVVGFGAMLPDLWRMAARPARARRGVTAAGQAPLSELLAGIEHHLDADDWFHRSNHFVEGERRAREALGDTGSPRMRLFAHVAWELCLDGSLVRALGDAELGTRVRAAALASASASGQAADLHHREARARAAVDEPTYQARLARIVDGVSSFELPRGYADARGVALRLAGIRSQFRLPPPTAVELDRWASALATLEPHADRTAHDLVTRRGP